MICKEGEYRRLTDMTTLEKIQKFLYLKLGKFLLKVVGDTRMRRVVEENAGSII